MAPVVDRPLRIAWSLAVTFAAGSGACTGQEFRAGECDEADCAGAGPGGSSNGGGSNRGGTNGSGEGGEATGGSSGSGTGGSGEGGSDVTGGKGGNGGSGGLAGLGGLGAIGGGGTGATDGGPFPLYGVLDDFNRPGPALGINWVGGASSYDLIDQTLQCAGGYCPAVFWHQAFALDQEVFATLTAFSLNAQEINLVLMGQGDPACDLIEVLYSPVRNEVLIEACWDGSWNSFGAIAVSFEPGDQLGGRLNRNGIIEVFKNGSPVGSVDANAFPFLGMPGRIGVNAVSDANVPDVWDDFGGGGPPPD
jgi:hypothetical protein